MSRPRWMPAPSRRDANEPEIVAVLRQVGCLVAELNEKDVPDLLVGLRGRWVLLEVKMPAGPRGGTDGRNLKPGQERFMLDCRSRGLPAHVVRSTEEALRALGLLDVEARFDFTDSDGGTDVP